ncbi:MAG: polysaccharide deacetylase family protein [Epulopiscium sp.]|nr:polysaccharide deacetylase family protein [Candidatus Epulonipiscium sp.]
MEIYIKRFFLFIVLFIPLILSPSPAVKATTPNFIITNGSKTQKKIALTFDDGPDNNYTLQILNVLRKHNTKATFFLLGVKTKEYPSVAKLIVDEGHVIGNHTYNHPNLYKKDLQTFRNEVEMTQELIFKTTGIRPNLFRAPYGNINENQLSELKSMGLTAVGWSVDSLDWKSLPSKAIETNVMPNIDSGSIILMHCAGHHTQNLTGTANALDKMIPTLKDKGYEFVTIAELMNKEFVMNKE